ncbi:hypothetical protein AVEN_113257-1 [Araneus ventricosus]|uniref:Uncharacterized protein n=1 Tax=Araneus ventricosus TaxID=182803 RepID=A0A4Y2HGT1_ARAVE|nr:hypothetical protein AVEN_113257-1 [Araneus ventricosus]
MHGTICGQQPYSMRTKKTWILISKNFRSQEKNLKFLYCVSRSSQEDKKLRKMVPFKVLHCNDEALTVCQLTDAEICSMVLMNSKTLLSNSEES